MMLSICDDKTKHETEFTPEKKLSNLFEHHQVAPALRKKIADTGLLLAEQFAAVGDDAVTFQSTVALVVPDGDEVGGHMGPVPFYPCVQLFFY